MTYVEWSVLGALLLLLELFVPGVYLLWFGIAGLIVGCITYMLELSLFWQWACFAGLSVVTTVVGFYIYKKVIKRSKSEYPHLNDLASQYLGKTVELIADVVNGETKVKVADSVWIASCKEDLKVGDIARVVGVAKNGVILIIQSIKK